MRKAIFFIVLFVIAFKASGQYNVTGKIVNQDGTALIGATIVFENSFKGVISGQGGKFQLNNIPFGEHKLIFSYIGYNSVEKIINLSANKNIEIILEKAPYGLEEVMVKASRAGLKDPVAVDMIDKEEIEQKNLGQDIPLLLSMSPSLVSSSDAGNGIGYSGFRIRGTDANRINITIDGIPLNDAESHGVWWVNMPDFASSLDNIQIQRGVGTSTNGSSAFGASVNLKTGGLSLKPYAETNSGLGSYGSWKTSNSIGTGLMENGLSFDIHYSLIGSDGYIDRAESSLKSLFISAGYYGEKNTLKFNLISGNEKTYQAWDGVPSYLLSSNRSYNGIGAYTDSNGNETNYDNETDNYSQNHFQLHFTREFYEGFSFNASLHSTLGEGYYEQYKNDQDFAAYNIPPAILNDSSIESSDMIVQKWLDNEFYGVVYSLIYRNNKIETRVGGSINRYVGDHFGKVIWSEISSSFDKDYRWYESQGIKMDYNAYFKINYEIARNLNFFTDLQLRKINYSIAGIDDDLRDISQNHDFLFFNPKFGINFFHRDNQRSYFSFGIANREPNRDNYVDADPQGPAPMNETLYDYELGYSISGEHIRTELNLYYMDYNNQLILTGEINDVGAPVMTNVKDSYRTGMELSLALRFNKRLEWSSNLTLSRNRLKNFTSLVDNWDYWVDPENEPYQYSNELKESELAFSPSITAASIISIIPVKNLKINFQSKYVGKQYIDNTGSEERVLNPWFVNDLILNYKIDVTFAESLDLSVMILNLFDHKYESNAWVYRYFTGGSEYKFDGYFPQAGLHFMSGVRLKF